MCCIVEVDSLPTGGHVICRMLDKMQADGYSFFRNNAINDETGDYVMLSFHLLDFMHLWVLLRV